MTTTLLIASTILSTLALLVALIAKADSGRAIEAAASSHESMKRIGFNVTKAQVHLACSIKAECIKEPTP